MYCSSLIFKIKQHSPIVNSLNYMYIYIYMYTHTHLYRDMRKYTESFVYDSQVSH